MNWRLKLVTESLFPGKFIIVNKSLQARGTARQCGLQLWQFLESLMKLLIIINHCYLIYHAYTWYIIDMYIIYMLADAYCIESKYIQQRIRETLLSLSIWNPWDYLCSQCWKVAGGASNICFRSTDSVWTLLISWVFCECNKNFL